MKKLLSCFLAALFCLSLISCTKQPENPEQKPENPPKVNTPADNPDNPDNPDTPENPEQKDPSPENPETPENPDSPTPSDVPEPSGTPESEIPSQWPTSGVAKRIPAPTKGKIEKTTDERTFFRADISGADMEYAQEYANLCRAEGFTEDVSEDLIASSTYMFSAENEKGYKVFVSYTGIMIVTISAP